MPQVISYRDMFRFVVHFIKQKMGKIDKKEMFLPNFRETFQAYCIHAGGRAIIDGLQETLHLTDEDCMPSRATLYRKVVAATGLSPARYIQTVRLNMAARMLENSDMSVTDIAIATGFSSIVHFSSSFRKKYGMSPTRYVHEKSQKTHNEHID